MPNTIRFRRGTSSPSAGSFQVGEPAWDQSSGRLYVKDNNGNMVLMNGTYTISATPPSGALPGDRWIDSDTGIIYTYLNDGNSSQWAEFGGPGVGAQGPAGTVSDGDKGDVTVASSGASITINDSVITNAKVSASAAIAGSKLQAATTTNAGAVQLTDSTSSTSTTTAATPNSVKGAYDLANAALPKSGGTLTGDVTLNAQSDIRFADADSSNWVAFQAPSVVSANVTWTLPAADGTAGQQLTTNGSGVLTWDTAGGAGGMTLLNTSTFNTAGTTSWTKPSGAQVVVVVCIGGGGGGASGTASTNTAVGGAGGGSGAAFCRAVLPAAALGATETVIVGAGGTGGAAVTHSTGANGTTASNPGGLGGDSLFGNYVKAEGGNGGTVNTTNNANTGGGAEISILSGYTIPVETGGAGGSGAATDNSPAIAATVATISMPSGGGAGGGANAAATAQNGAAGGTAGATAGGTAGTGSTTQGGATAGGAGSISTNGLQASGGGGGGNCATSAGSATAGAGGNGAAAGAGGGGGGASRVAAVAGNVSTSGKGGDGGVGFVRVYTYG